MIGRSRLFSTDLYIEIEDKVIDLINGTPDIVNHRSLESPRAVGDAIQGLLEDEFPTLLPEDAITEYNASFARRSMADFAFEDSKGLYHVVDNKTHNLDTTFNMPNLTSVERLSRFYEDDNNYFTLLMVAYRVGKKQILAEKCHFLPVEHLNWTCLTIGALGWGQLQISNMNNIEIDRKQTRKKWMLKLCDRLADFYPKEIAKISDRIGHFEKVRKHWMNHPDF